MINVAVFPCQDCQHKGGPSPEPCYCWLKYNPPWTSVSQHKNKGAKTNLFTTQLIKRGQTTQSKTAPCNVSLSSFCVCALVAGVHVPLARPLWLMALLKCCEEKYYFDSLLRGRKKNLHSGQTRGRSRLSLVERLGTISSSFWCWFFGFSRSALAHRENTTKKAYYVALSFGNALWEKVTIPVDNGNVGGNPVKDTQQVSTTKPPLPVFFWDFPPTVFLLVHFWRKGLLSRTNWWVSIDICSKTTAFVWRVSVCLCVCRRLG